MADEPRPVQRFGRILMVTKEFRADVGIDLDAFLRREFDATLPETHQRYGDVEVEWIDGDDTESMMGRLNQDLYLEAGVEPPRNIWWIRISGFAVENVPL